LTSHYKMQITEIITLYKLITGKHLCCHFQFFLLVSETLPSPVSFYLFLALPLCPSPFLFTCYFFYSFPFFFFYLLSVLLINKLSKRVKFLSFIYAFLCLTIKINWVCISECASMMGNKLPMQGDYCWWWCIK
jgi:hypothetical protein